jgi:hypothetical protein
MKPWVVAPALIGACCLALVAFWPSSARETRKRPPIQGAIVFDELRNATLPTRPSASP